MFIFNYFKQYLISILIILLVCAKIDGKSKSVNIGGHVQFEPKNNSKFSASWKVQGENIQFTIIGETTGYIGFGFSPNGGMAGADIVIGGVHRNGSSYFMDTNSPGFFEPLLDKSQDYKLLSASENGTHTTIKFTRKIKTCDEDDWQIDSSTVKLIYAFGKTDKLGYHKSNRGVASANLLDPKKKSHDLSQYKTFDTKVDMVMPSVKTMYWCTVHKSPSFSRKQHLIGLDVILSNDAAVKHTHHMILHKCTPLPGESAEDAFGIYVGHPGMDCYEKNSNDSKFPRDHCLTYQHVWAIGGGIVMYPPHVGIPLMGNDYFMLEIHYDNPKEKIGTRFESGFKLFYTNKLRKYEGGVMNIGAVVGYTLMIPPNSKNFTVVSHCHSNCTNYLPSAGINVFSIALHSHMSGRKMRARLFRNGKELPWPMDDQNYDINFQRNRPLERELKILRGDHLVTECVYDTTWRNGEPVIGGRATTEEMCMVFYFYYPYLQDFMECNSAFPSDTLWEFLGIKNLTGGLYENDPLVTEPEALAGKSYTQVIKEFDWTSERRIKYQEEVHFGPHDGFCYPLGETFVTGYPDGYQKRVYVPKDPCFEKN